MLKKYIVSLLLLSSMIIPQHTFAQFAESELTVESKSGSVTVEEDIIKAEYTTNNSTAKADFVIPSTDMNERAGMYISFEAYISGSEENTLRSMQVISGSKAIEVFRLSGAGIKLFSGSEQSISLPVDEYLPYELYFDFESGKAVVNIGEESFTAVSDAVKDWATDDVSLKFRNYCLKKTSVNAKWYFKEISRTPIEAYSFWINAENNSYFTQGEIDNIEISYGALMSKTTLDEGNYSLFFEGEAMDISVTENGNGVIIESENDFFDIGSYRLVITEISDVFGTVKESGRIVEFDVVGDMYPAPEISWNLNGDGSEIKVGEKIDISVTADSEEIEKTELYIDNKAVKEIFSDVLEYTFKPEAEGEYVIYAKATDGLGRTAETEKFTLCVQKNNPPQIEVDGVVSGQQLFGKDLGEVFVGISDEDGIENARVTLDNKAVSFDDAADITVDLKALEYGEHMLVVYAKDTLGAEITKKIQFSVTDIFDVVTKEEDFEKATSGGTSNGVSFKSQRGYVKAMEIDKEHGLSGVVGMDTVNEGYNPADRPFLQVTMPETTGFITASYDFYINEFTANNDPMAFALKQNGGAEMNAVSFYEGVAKSGNETVLLDTKEWYRVTLLIDFEKREVTAKIINASGVAVADFAPVAMPGNMSEVSFIRIWGPSGDAVKTFMAIDNLVIMNRRFVPQIIGFAGDTESIDEGVNYTSSTVKVYLSGAVYAPSVNKSSVFLYERGAPVEYDTIECSGDGKVITLKLLSEMRSRTQYTVELTDAVMITNTVGISSGIKGSFTTSDGDIEIIGVDFGEGYITVNANSTMEADMEIKIIATVWKNSGEEVVRSHIFSDTLIHGMGFVKQFPVHTTVDEELYVYIWSNEEMPRMLSREIFKK